MQEVDFLVIGGGSAGYAAARTMASLGLKTMVADQAEKLGGLCILRGCMPSKALIASANRMLHLRDANKLGIEAASGRVNLEKIQARKRAHVENFAQYRQGQLEDGRFELARAAARFVGPHEAELTDTSGKTKTVRFKAACIASGSKVMVPSVPGLEEMGYWTSDDILEANPLPKRLIVLGGGAIALEMAHYVEAMGSEVIVIQRSQRLISELDDDLGEELQKCLEKRERFQIFTGTALKRVEKTKCGSKRIVFEQGGQELQVEGDEILLALGRVPHLESLNLETVGVELKKGRIEVNDRQQTQCPWIFAAGDVVGTLAVVHLAIQQGEIAAQNAAHDLGKGNSQARFDLKNKLYGIFTEPEVAVVGLSEKEAKSQGIDYQVSHARFDDHGMSLVKEETDGFVKLLACSKTGELLGAAAIGNLAVELIHVPAMAIHLRATLKDLVSAPFYHPTLSELWAEPAENML